MRWMTTAVTALFLGVAASSASAGTVYLEGVTAYRCDTTTGANTSNPYEFDNFTDGITSELALSGYARGSAIQLIAGDNVFTWSTYYDSAPLGLCFFLGSANSQVGYGTAPNLVGFTDSGNVGPYLPAAGTQVATSGAYSSNVGYSGATYFDVGSDRVTLTGMSRSGVGGTFTLTVEDTTAAVPLPSAAWTGLGLLAALGVLRGVRRRGLPGCP